MGGVDGAITFRLLGCCFDGSCPRLTAFQHRATSESEGIPCLT